MLNKSIKIYCLDNSKLVELEAMNRGYRADIYVKTISGDIFHLHVYNIIRLKQDFETEIESYGFFGIEPNIILVEEVIMSNIILTIEKLFKQKFFESLKPIDDKEIASIILLEV